MGELWNYLCTAVGKTFNNLWISPDSRNYYSSALAAGTLLFCCSYTWMNEADCFFQVSPVCIQSLSLSCPSFLKPLRTWPSLGQWKEKRKRGPYGRQKYRVKLHLETSLWGHHWIWGRQVEQGACLGSSLLPLQNRIINDPSPLITYSRSDFLLYLIPDQTFCCWNAFKDHQMAGWGRGERLNSFFCRRETWPYFVISL